MYIKRIKKKHLKKEKWFRVIEKENPGVLKEVEHYLDNYGMVLARKKWGTIECLCFFASDDDNNKTLRHVKDVFIEKVDGSDRNELINNIKESISENVSMDELSEVEWDGVSYKQNTTKIGGLAVPTGVIFITFGLILSVLLDNFLWFFIGLLLGLTCGVATIEVKKNKRKKK